MHDVSTASSQTPVGCVNNNSSNRNNSDVTSGDKPVNDSAHINLQVTVVSQQPLLYLDQVDRLVIQSQQTHTALKHCEGVPTLQTVILNRASWGGKHIITTHNFSTIYSPPPPVLQIKLILCFDLLSFCVAWIVCVDFINSSINKDNKKTISTQYIWVCNFISWSENIKSILMLVSQIYPSCV